MRATIAPRFAAVLAASALLATAWSAGWVRPAVAQNDPLSVVEYALDVVNDGDIDGFMVLWADEGVWEVDACYAIFGPGGCVGKAAIRAVLTPLIEDGFSWTSTQELQVSGNRVTDLGAEMRIGELAQVGIERLLFASAAWDVVDGKVARVHLDPDLLRSG